MNQQPQPTVLFLSSDLVFSSRVKSAATAAGYGFRVGASLPQDGLGSIRYVVLDLSTKSGLVPDFVDQAAQNCPEAELIAYGPHVHEAKLAAAKEAGIPLVLTQGQFSSKLPQLFAGG